IARMPATVFREIIHRHPDVSEQLLLQLVARIRTLDQRVNEFSSMHVKTRIYAELLRRSRPDPTHKRKAVVSPPPVHSDIAARVSTRREMVARELKALERAGLLTKRRGAVVLDNVPELMHMPEQKDSRGGLPRWVSAQAGTAPGRWTLLHRVDGDFGQLGRAVVGKQRNAERGAAEGREGGRKPDLEGWRTVAVGAAFADVMMVTVLLTHIRRADDGKKLG